MTMSCNESSSLIQSLETQEKIANSYHFYPSTMRMLNFTDIESFNKLVKNIDQMTMMRMDTEVFSSDDLKGLLTDLQKEEKYEVFMEMSNSRFQYYVLGKDKKDKTLMLINSDEGQFIVDIKGTPNLMQIPNIMNDLNALDSSQTSGITLFRDLLADDVRDRERRKKYEARRAERKRRKEMEADSIKNAMNSEQVDTISNVQ